MSKHIYNTGAAGVGHVRARFGGGLVVLWSEVWYGMVWYGMVCWYRRYLRYNKMVYLKSNKAG